MGRTNDYRKIIAVVGLFMLVLNLSARLRLFGGGVGVSIELPKFNADRSDKPSAALPDGGL